jgi:hypothetical protein
LYSGWCSTQSCITAGQYSPSIRTIPSGHPSLLPGHTAGAPAEEAGTAEEEAEGPGTGTATATATTDEDGDGDEDADVDGDVDAVVDGDGDVDGDVDGDGDGDGDERSQAARRRSNAPMLWGTGRRWALPPLPFRERGAGGGEVSLLTTVRG